MGAAKAAAPSLPIGVKSVEAAESRFALDLHSFHLAALPQPMHDLAALRRQDRAR